MSDQATDVGEGPSMVLPRHSSPGESGVVLYTLSEEQAYDLPGGLPPQEGEIVAINGFAGPYRVVGEPTPLLEGNWELVLQKVE